MHRWLVCVCGTFNPCLERYARHTISRKVKKYFEKERVKVNYNTRINIQVGIGILLSLSENMEVQYDKK